MSSKDELSILWVIPKWTLPAFDGARVATEKLIMNTISAGAHVDILCLPQEFEKIDETFMLQKWRVKNIKVIKRSLPEERFKKYRYFFKRLISVPLMPVTFSSFYDPKLKKEIHSFMQNKKYDVLLLDGLHLAIPWFKKGHFYKPLNVKHVIYRAHNLEQDLWKKAVSETKNFLMKSFLKFQAKMVEKIEKKVISSVDGVAPIALEDLHEIKKIFPSVVQSLTPLGLNFRSSLEQNISTKLNLLFIGRLDWPPNRDGLRWILDEVWPKVILNRADIELNIVGSGNRNWLAKYNNMSGIKIHGHVEDIKDSYQKCHFTIVPIKYGSGTRIKVLEAYAMGRSLISTTMGVQGAGLTDSEYTKADSTEDWIQTLSNIILTNDHINSLKESQLKLAKNFDEKIVGENFYSWLKSLV